jgi:hypothetical protein
MHTKDEMTCNLITGDSTRCDAEYVRSAMGVTNNIVLDGQRYTHALEIER